MITPKTQYNLRNARDYFREHLAHGDYYSEKQAVLGQWVGAGAEKLGLKGDVQELDFLAMCEGRNPATGDRLTARMNTVRNVGGVQQANRRVFFDFVFRPPKSVSLVALCADARVIELHNQAVREALVELEKFACTRVRKDGEQGQRTTGNFAAALFTHDASRALDPLLHTHAVIFNATFDDVEQRWKALENSEMLKAQKLVSAVYDAKLTGGLVALGYGIRRERQSYEIDTVDRETIEKFSKRRHEIERIAASESARGDGHDIYRLRDQIAHDHRSRKIKDANAETLRDLWLGQMTVDEIGTLRPAGDRPAIAKDAALAEAARIADGMLFERKSVVPRRELEAAILHEALGSGVALSDVRPLVDSARYVGDSERTEFTSHDSLAAEMAVLSAARNGRDTQDAISPGFDAERPELDPEQRVALAQIAASRDFVTLFRGAAGTGKSRTLSAVCEAIERAGKAAVVVAPQASQVRDLVGQKMNAQTLARLLTTRELAPGAVVVVDEAGQIGARQMRELFALVNGAGGRLVLSGDTRQHGAVEASDALIAIEKFAGLKAAQLTRIRRQNPEAASSVEEAQTIAAYKRAVEAASEGNVTQSLGQLERMGAVQIVPDGARTVKVADAIVAEIEHGADVLAVSQTRAEAASVNEAVTRACIARGLIEEPQSVETLVPRDMLAMERTLARTYQPGDEVQFVSRYGSNQPGEIRRVVHVTDDALLLEPRAGEEKAARVSLRYAEKWNLIERKPVTLGVGSRVQLKFNGKSSDGERIVNGELCTVRRILRDGSLVVEDPTGTRKTLAPEQRVLLPGYCVTSYSAQGKSVDAVILADSGSRGATSQREWYVSISRAKRRIKVFTGDVEDLRERIQTPGTDKLALEVKQRPQRQRRRTLSAAHRMRLAKRLGARLGRKLASIIKEKGPSLWHHG